MQVQNWSLFIFYIVGGKRQFQSWIVFHELVQFIALTFNFFFSRIVLMPSLYLFIVQGHSFSPNVTNNSFLAESSFFWQLRTTFQRNNIFLYYLTLIINQNVWSISFPLLIHILCKLNSETRSHHAFSYEICNILAKNNINSTLI